MFNIYCCPNSANYIILWQTAKYSSSHAMSQNPIPLSTVVYMQFSLSPPLGCVCHQTKSPTGWRDFIQIQSPSLPRSVPPSHHVFRPPLFVFFVFFLRRRKKTCFPPTFRLDYVSLHHKEVFLLLVVDLDQSCILHSLAILYCCILGHLARRVKLKTSW